MIDRERGSANPSFLLTLVLFLPFVSFFVARSIKDTQFDIQVTERLKRAADANTVELAEQELSAVVKHLEVNGLISGYTSVLYRTPNEDVGFWYNNLKSSLVELRKVKPEATQLERSNVLMKLRETLLDGRWVNRPNGIEVFPNNIEWAWFGCLTLSLAVINLVTIFRRLLTD